MTNPTTIPVILPASPTSFGTKAKTLSKAQSLKPEDKDCLERTFAANNREKHILDSQKNYKRTLQKLIQIF